jgi:hypothetical protein
MGGEQTKDACIKTTTAKAMVTDACKKKTAFWTRLVKGCKKVESYFPHSEFWYHLFGTHCKNHLCLTLLKEQTPNTRQTT